MPRFNTPYEWFENALLPRMNHSERTELLCSFAMQLGNKALQDMFQEEMEDDGYFDKYIAGWNMPGCLPEAEPCGFATFDEAKRYIIEELKNMECTSGGYGDQDLAEEYCHLAEDVNLESGPFDTMVLDDYVYWVTPAE